MSSAHDKIAVTKTVLNTAPFIDRSVTVATVITNQSYAPFYDFTFTDTYKLTGYSYADGTAILFYNGKKHTLKATAAKNKITLEGINVPPRESVFIFYRLHKLTD